MATLPTLPATDRQNQCARKGTYSSEHLAENAAQLYEWAQGWRFDWYRCPWCSGWHLTSPRRRPMTAADLATSGEWTLDLPITRPLSLNDREHWQTKRKRVRTLRTATARLAESEGIPACARIAAALHYAPRDRRDRDRDNLVATLKPVHDGLVDAGVIPKDTPAFVDSPWPAIDEPTGRRTGRLYVVVTALPPLEVTP